MRMRYPSILLCLILVTPPSSVVWIGEGAASEATQIDNQKDFATYSEAVQIAQKILTQLGKGSVPNSDGVAQAVARGFNLLQSFIENNKELAQELGFQIGQDKRVEDIIKDTKKLLDNAFPVFEIHLDDLQNFSPGSDPRHLLLFTNQLLFPIRDNQNVQSSLTIRFTLNKQSKMDDKQPGLTWRPTRWGQKKLISLLTETQREQLATRKPGFLVSIPSLNRDFLGYTDNLGIKLVPLTDDRLLNLKQGKSVPAEKVLETLVEEARSLDDRPR
jgi:hypothetical protein